MKSYKAILMGGILAIVIIIVGGSLLLIRSNKNPEEDIELSYETESQSDLMDKEFWIIQNDELIEPQWSETRLNTNEVYTKIQYNTHMFYGAYGLVPDSDSNDEINKWYDEMNFDMHRTAEGRYLTDLPYRIEAGPNTMNHVLNNNLDHDWMVLHFFTEDRNSYSMYAAFEIEKNILRFTEASWKFDSNTETLDYEVGNTYEYWFSFNGVQLTLSYGDKSVILQADGFDKEIVGNANYEGYHLSVDNGPYPNLERIDGVNKLTFLCISEDNRFYIEDSSGNTIRNGNAQLNKDGIFCFTYADNHKVNTKHYYYEYVFFYCGKDGIILTDGEHCYCYQYKYSATDKPYYPISKI